MHAGRLREATWGFESAAFKLSHEMVQLMDPSGTRASSHFKYFEELCVRGYLAVSGVAAGLWASSRDALEPLKGPRLKCRRGALQKESLQRLR